MNGVDWDAKREEYAPLLRRVGCGSELRDLIEEMGKELSASHIYFDGVDKFGYGSTSHQKPQGYLGAQVEWDQT